MGVFKLLMYSYKHVLVHRMTCSYMHIFTFRVSSHFTHDLWYTNTYQYTNTYWYTSNAHSYTSTHYHISTHSYTDTHCHDNAHWYAIHTGIPCALVFHTHQYTISTRICIAKHTGIPVLPQCTLMHNQILAYQSRYLGMHKHTSI